MSSSEFPFVRHQLTPLDLPPAPQQAQCMRPWLYCAFIASEFLLRCSDIVLLRVPDQLLVNSTQAKTPRQSHTGMVTRGVIGGAVALLAVGAVALVAWHRRRRDHGDGRTSPGSSFLGASTNPGTQFAVAPFNPTMLTPTEAAPLAAGTQMNFHQRMFSRPFPPDSPPSLRSMVSVPVGLSGKELARLRSNRLLSQPMVGRASYPPLTVAIGRDALDGAASSSTSSSEARRTRSENNISMHEIHEIQQHGVERSEPPPSYVSRPQGPNMF